MYKEDHQVMDQREETREQWEMEIMKSIKLCPLHYLVSSSYRVGNVT